MSRLFNDAATEYLEINQAVLAGVPLAMVCFANTNDLAENQVLMGVGLSTGNPDGYLIIIVGGVDDSFRAYTVTGAGGSFAQATVIPSVDTWHHFCGLFVSATDRRALIDGTNKGTESTSRVPSTPNRTRIGCRADNFIGDFQYTSGMIAEAAIYDLSALPGATDSDKADYFEANVLPDLAIGVKPCLHPLGLVAYWPLKTASLVDEIGSFNLTASGTSLVTGHPLDPRGLNDKVGGFNLTAVGTVISAHPQIILPHGVL